MSTCKRKIDQDSALEDRVATLDIEGPAVPESGQWLTSRGESKFMSSITQSLYDGADDNDAAKNTPRSARGNSRPKGDYMTIPPKS